jgi:hypothetical protein
MRWCGAWEMKMGAKMDDLAQRRILEIDIDKLKRSRNPEAALIGDEGERALKDSELEKSREIVDRGLELIAPKKLIDVLTTTGGMKSRAEARRSVAAGGVRVDQKRAVDVEMDVKHAKSIKIGDREILVAQ